ncbi:MAG: glycosyltransferase [Candidatus Colwellbacteria bacterium]|nr:glycosyltransferase [Candidatus Colwellbacteria bacterium]
MILEEVSVKKKNINKYRKVVGAEVIGGLKSFSRSLKGKRVVHINSTAKGGGVAEILMSLVPLQRSLGVDSRWFVVNPPAKFFEITKKFHNALQGAKIKFSKAELDYYLKINEQFAEELSKLKADLFIIHDPQPLASWHFVRRSLGEGGLNYHPRAISRIHIDLSTPNKQLLEFLLPYLKEYDKVIFSLKSFVPKGLPVSRVAIIPPAIDPLAPKNEPMNLSKAKKVLAGLGVDVSRPVVAQVSRFDSWKDPIGVIDAYCLAKKRIKGLQLVLLGNAIAKDDPESAMMIKKVKKYAGDDPDIHLVNVDGEILVNAVQTAADIVLQKSIREGFGLTATEALWKKRPVIAGNVGGLALQIDNPHNGILVEKPNTAADAVVKLLRNKKFAAELGKEGHRTVLKNYLITRLIRDHHRLYQNLI